MPIFYYHAIMRPPDGPGQFDDSLQTGHVRAKNHKEAKAKLAERGLIATYLRKLSWQLALLTWFDVDIK